MELNAEIEDATFELPPEIRAQLPEEPGAGFTVEQLMAFLNTNGDGMIAKGEMEALKTSFKGLDKNGDGEIDAAEANPARNDQTPSPPRATVTAEQLMDLMDTNRDGKITTAEST